MKPARQSSQRQAAPRPVIFVVDDEAMILAMIERMLAGEQCHVRLFRNPESALDSLSAADPPPRLLVTDYALGPTNGAQLIERCRRLVPSIRTLLMSGSIPEEAVRALDVQPDRFLSKPFDSGAFVRLVRELLATDGTARPG
jgi:DNA-binding NtrC family response regulator